MCAVSARFESQMRCEVSAPSRCLSQYFKIFILGTSLVVQWVRLRTPKAGGLGSIPGQGTRSRMHAATRSPHAATKKKIPQATTKTWRSLNKYLKKKQTSFYVCQTSHLVTSLCQSDLHTFTGISNMNLEMGQIKTSLMTYHQ